MGCLEWWRAGAGSFQVLHFKVHIHICTYVHYDVSLRRGHRGNGVNLGRNVSNFSTLVGRALNRLPPLREYYLLQQSASKVAPCMRLQGCVCTSPTQRVGHIEEEGIFKWAATIPIHANLRYIVAHC